MQRNEIRVSPTLDAGLDVCNFVNWATCVADFVDNRKMFQNLKNKCTKVLKSFLISNVSMIYLKQLLIYLNTKDYNYDGDKITNNLLMNTLIIKSKQALLDSTFKSSNFIDTVVSPETQTNALLLVGKNMRRITLQPLISVVILVLTFWILLSLHQEVLLHSFTRPHGPTKQHLGFPVCLILFYHFFISFFLEGRFSHYLLFVHVRSMPE